MVETEEPQRQLPQLPPVPRGKGPSVSHPEFTPWIPASFLPGALPTACGGSPGNTPVSADPRALWMRKVHADSRRCRDSLEGCLKFGGVGATGK